MENKRSKIKKLSREKIKLMETRKYFSAPASSSMKNCRRMVEIAGSF